jgi:signal transduction histidine kinase
VPLDAPDELVDLGAQLEAALARVDESGQQAAAAVEKSRREIVAWLSHDLRTSLAGIRAMADALEDGLVDDPATVARYHHTMRKEIDRLAGLVDDLFELSRIDTGAVALDLEQVPLDALVSDAVAGPADGCGGIPPPELPRVFDLAYQGHGEISVADDGGGCRFTIRLPLVANGQSPHSQPTSTS